LTKASKVFRRGEKNHQILTSLFPGFIGNQLDKEAANRKPWNILLSIRNKKKVYKTPGFLCLLGQDNEGWPKAIHRNSLS